MILSVNNYCKQRRQNPSPNDTLPVHTIDQAPPSVSSWNYKHKHSGIWLPFQS